MMSKSWRRMVTGLAVAAAILPSQGCIVVVKEQQRFPGVWPEPLVTLTDDVIVVVVEEVPASQLPGRRGVAPGVHPSARPGSRPLGGLGGSRRVRH